jgi:hypothetical protein
MTAMVNGSGDAQPEEGGVDHDSVVAARFFAGLAAVLFAVPFFGIVDLSTAPSQPGGDFYDYYLLETGWGLLYTFLVPVPFVMWSCRPWWTTPARQLIAIAACVVLVGLATPDIGHVVLGLLFGAGVVGINHYLRRPLWPRRDLVVHGLNPLLVLLLLAVAGAAAVYATAMIDAARSGEPDSITMALRHLPMQAAFALAIPVSAAVAVLASAAGAPGWRIAAVPAAVSAAWFGVLSVIYPDHLGSLGQRAGYVAIGWGAAFATAVALTGRRSLTGDPSEL